MKTATPTLVLERDITAPIEKVWNAFVHPETLKQWWSPPGMHCSFLEADVEEGGRFRYCFKMDEGEGEFWGRGIYQQIDKPQHLSYLDSFTDAKGYDVPESHYGLPGNEIKETLAAFFFTTKGEKTHIKLVAENPYDEKMTTDMTSGWNGMFDKLQTLLEK